MSAHFEMREYGLTFGTRQRAAAIAPSIPHGPDAEIDFKGVLAATPGFLDALIGELSRRETAFRITGLAPMLKHYADRIIVRRGLESQFSLKE